MKTSSIFSSRLHRVAMSAALVVFASGSAWAERFEINNLSVSSGARIALPDCPTTSYVVAVGIVQSRYYIPDTL